MISVTPYTFQPATCRVARLWRNARAVSDWLTLRICCPCCETMSLTGSAYSNTSEKSSVHPCELLPSPVVDAGRANGEPFQPHHVIIDFNPRPEDTDEVQERCIEFLKLIDNSPILNKKIENDISEEAAISCTRSREKIIICEKSQEDEFPAIHAMKQLEAKGAVKTAFETCVVKT